MGRQPAVTAGFGPAQAVADAILFEGYLLYPYRRSSGKNRVRWQFGVLLPEPWARAHGLTDTGVAGSAESWWQQTECLLEAGERAALRIRLRFLQVQRRTIEERLPGGSYRAVERLETPAGLELSFDEAVPRELDLTASLADLLAGEQQATFEVPGGEDSGPLPGAGGTAAGRVRRRRWPLRVRVTLSATACPGPSRLHRLRVRTENGDRTAGGDREAVLRRSLLAAHTLLAADGGAFLSLLDPPQWAAPAAQACVNVHTFPVLAGPPGERGQVLSSPILLYDHPQVAPESPGDLHDAAEIDEILSLRTLTLTDAEKREARATDPRATEIIDRAGSLPPEVMARLHGAVRSLRPLAAGHADTARKAATAGHEDTQHNEDSGGAPAGQPVPWWDPGADAGVSPETDAVIIDGARVARGSRVRLRPRQRGTDPQDMFLAGRTALVQAVLLDVDGSQHLAVTLDDDPGADLHQWYGRYRYFAPAEIEPLPGEPA